MREKSVDRGYGQLSRLAKMTPREIQDGIHRVYKGNDDEVKRFAAQISLILAQMLQLSDGMPSDLLPRQGSLVLIGPTGSGKTALASAAASALGVKFMVIDCSDLTGAGWKGGDISAHSSALAEWQEAHPGRVTLLLLDEFDKVVKQDDRYDSFDPQNSLLKFFDGFDGGLQGARSNDKYFSEKQVDFTRVIPVLCGAFTGIENLIRLRLKDTQVIRGLLKKEGIRSPNRISGDALRSFLTLDDLHRWGLKIELLGRLCEPIVLPSPSPKLFKAVLLDGDTALVKRYERLLPPGCCLQVSDEAADIMVHKAIEAGTGVRGVDAQLRSIVADVRLSLLEDETLAGVKVDTADSSSFELLWISDDGRRRQAEDEVNGGNSNSLEAFDEFMNGPLAWTSEVSLISLVGMKRVNAIAEVLFTYEPDYIKAVKEGHQPSWDHLGLEQMCKRLLKDPKHLFAEGAFGPREVFITGVLVYYCLISRGRHYRLREKSLNEMLLSDVLLCIHSMVKPLPGSPLVGADDRDAPRTVFESLLYGMGPATYRTSFMGRYELGEYEGRGEGDMFAEQLVRGCSTVRALSITNLRAQVSRMLNALAELDGPRVIAWMLCLDEAARKLPKGEWDLY